MQNRKRNIKKKLKLTSIDKVMYFASFAYPLTTIPQLYKVYTTQDVSSLAISTWVLYVVFGSVFVAYSVSKKLTPLIIQGSLWVVTYALMVLAIILFS